MNLKVDTQKLAQICQKYGVDYLSVFGSVARGEDQPGSDVDLLVKFGSHGVKGLFGMARMRDELEQLLGRDVDLLTEGFLSKYFRDDVLNEAKPIYHGQTQ